MKKKKKLPASCIILAHTRDSKLENAINSADCFDETLLVATTDEKEAWKIFAKKNNCILHFYLDPIFNFSTLRNWAANKSKNDWVFFLDSDEVIDKASVAKLYDFYAKNTYGHTSLSVIRQDIFLGKKLKYGEAYTTLVRAFDKKHHAYTGSVHETVNSTQNFQSSIVLNHYAHNSIADFLQDITVYSHMASYGESTTQLVLIIKMFIFPITKWFNNLFIKKGILDGYTGIIYATIMSIHSLSVRIFAYENSLSKNK